MPSAVAANGALISNEEQACGAEVEGQAKGRAMSMVCEECCEQESKYRCPGCGFRTCGVKCVKSHKERTKCDGKRKRTEFVNINDYNDNWLISDYNLLEETLRLADSAKRLRAPFTSGVRNEVPPQVKALQKQAKARSTTLLLLAHGMTKRAVNTSYFDKRNKRIFWRVEWVFEGTDVRLVDSRVDENSTLESVLAKHLAHDAENVTVRYLLRSFRWKPLHELVLLLPKEPCSAAEKEYFELTLGNPLKDQLADKSIVEYPTIHVLLPGSLGNFASAKISKAVPPKVLVPDEIVGDRIQDPQELEGVPFKEEDFEEGEYLEDGEIIS
ncbi:zinc finger HIT domain-containing protein 3 [Marchantia polymorpha subsp. ruderalis]|uniref:HIT-type domain-containing protein n=2 Tax=Marchantia polymorpha TaxID=3197 RepID=A0A176WS58_MARPO|nr:hypothetical protein AXG93_4461s1050 [Marchantia polymorpha subsp. ruderalis]PTQ32110.1 hypothetical protein MARPO_0103s0075 [Marchantia polymorpha]BBM96718.1 hypothetical protein Mp_1g00110 [Marchantia polymorpha subsp. ruderalis]|eukprot:PTQ32110.1 hypothetical protein MARPO_0103s0075 [Marchantia polymorpha]